MKLIFCPKCCDVVKLSRTERFCDCEASWGYYENDGLIAHYGGFAVPLGFANRTLVQAIKNQPDEGMGKRFEAFVIPKSCPTFTKMAGHILLPLHTEI